MEKILNKINKYSLFALVFLVPLFFLPFTQNILNYPKRVLMLFLVAISLIAWLVKQKMKGEITLKGINKGFYWVSGLLLVTFVLASVFSQWMGVSFWGMPYSVADSLLSFLVLILLSFLIIHSFQNKDYLKLIQLLIGVGALVSLFAILQLYGASLGVGASTLIGGFNVTAIFAAVLLPLALALLFHTSEKKWFLGIGSSILLLSIVLINFKAAWLVLMLGVLVSLFFSTWSSEFNLNWSLVLMGCLALALFFFLFRFTLPFLPARPPEISLGLSSEYDIVRGTLQESFKNKILGSGPATFSFEYSQHHSSLINRTPFWGTRFNQGNSVLWDWVVTKGILGGLALVALWGFALWKGLKRVVQPDTDQWGVKLGIFSSLTALIGASFLVSFNFSLWFLFWTILGVMVGLLYSGIKKIEINSKGVNVAYSSLLVLVVLLGVGLVFLQGIRYYAANQHKQGLSYSRQGNLGKAINHVSNATELSELPFNSAVDLYYRDLGQIYLNQASKVAADESQINRGLVQKSISEGAAALNRATEIAPFNSANWNVRGYFYRNLIGVQQAGELALNSYRKAAELEPASPFAHTEIGRINILMAQKDSDNREKLLNNASDALQTALDLKPDYASAHYLRAVIYDQQGDLEKAISNLEKAEVTAGEDVGLTYQLGLLYWRNNDLSKAQTKFEQAVKANANYANAHYMLGLVYDRKDQKEKAIEQFEKVAELNPDNKRVKDILSNLEQDRPALEGVGTTTAPLEGTPEEIKE
ncbi:MAG: tetratricopeptide repeat protein [Candidatus Paceibacterota bacterium]